ncbi:MAG: AEC family transporter, partial [Gammaproteobacteria bacterium]|nr:AEC family transporter [Gammaproteobacteria bacterium]
ALAGLVVNIAGIKLPGWLAGISGLAGDALVPLLLLAVGLSLSWNKSWTNQVKDILPVAAIKLILIPLVLLIMVKVFGSPGAKTTKALMINGIMPASLLGFYICSRFKFDTAIYAIAFVVTSALAVLAVPIWLEIL